VTTTANSANVFPSDFSSALPQSEAPKHNTENTRTKRSKKSRIFKIFIINKVQPHKRASIQRESAVLTGLEGKGREGGRDGGKERGKRKERKKKLSDYLTAD
jgi:hypothetical protein